MPGVNKKVVNISPSDGEQMLLGQVDNVDESECECFIMKGIPEGNYFRSFKVGDGIDVDKIKAVSMKVFLISPCPNMSM